MTEGKILGKHKNGEDIIQYTLTNSLGVEVKILNYGAIIQAINLPLKTGIRNIVLGFDDYRDYLSEEYINKCPYFGATIGRIAGRVKNGELFLDGKIHQLSCNEGNHHLHGGNEGFDKKIWKLEALSETCVILKYFSPDGEEGYPNDANISVKYSLQENNSFVIEHKADSEKKIPVNMTNHTYFNLGDEDTILNHIMSFETNKYLETDSDLNYTGRILEIDKESHNGTHKRIGDDMPESGYDMTLYEKGKNVFFHLREEKSGLTLKIHTYCECLHLYAGKYINTKDHKAYSGIALEPMNFPYLPLRVNNAKYDKESPYKTHTEISFYTKDQDRDNIFELLQ